MAKFDGAPYNDHFGSDGVGQLVKTVHNVIEIADMQFIYEICELMRYGHGQSPSDIGAVFDM